MVVVFKFCCSKGSPLFERSGGSTAAVRYTSLPRQTTLFLGSIVFVVFDGYSRWVGVPDVLFVLGTVIAIEARIQWHGLGKQASFAVGLRSPLVRVSFFDLGCRG